MSEKTFGCLLPFLGLIVVVLLALYAVEGISGNIATAQNSQVAQEYQHTLQAQAQSRTDVAQSADRLVGFQSFLAFLAAETVISRGECVWFLVIAAVLVWLFITWLRGRGVYPP